MTDFDDYHDEALILDLAYEPVVPDPVSPQLTELLSLKSLSDSARIIQPG